MERGIADEKRELIGGENKNIKGGGQAMRKALLNTPGMVASFLELGVI